MGAFNWIEFERECLRGLVVAEVLEAGLESEWPSEFWK